MFASSCATLLTSWVDIPSYSNRLHSCVCKVYIPDPCLGSVNSRATQHVRTLIVYIWTFSSVKVSLTNWKLLNNYNFYFNDIAERIISLPICLLLLQETYRSFGRLSLYTALQIPQLNRPLLSDRLTYFVKSQYRGGILNCVFLCWTGCHSRPEPRAAYF